MAVVDLGELGEGSATTAGTTLAVVNTTGATIAAGTMIHIIGTWDNIASVTAPTITCSTVGGGTATANHATAIGSGVTTTAGSGVWHQCFRVLTTSTIASGATIATLTSNQSAVKRVAIAEGYSGATSTLRNTVVTATSTGGTASASAAGTPLVADDIVIGSISGENNAIPSADIDTSSGTWSSMSGLATTGGQAATNVTVGTQSKVVTAASGQTYNPSSANDVVACIFALVPKATVQVDRSTTWNVLPDPTVTITRSTTWKTKREVGYIAIFGDDFTGPDDSDGLYDRGVSHGRLSSIGFKEWEQGAGDWPITGNKVTTGSGGSVVLDAGIPDVSVWCDYHTPNVAVNSSGLAVRFWSNNDLINVVAVSGTWRITRVVATNSLILGSGGTALPNTTYQLRVDCVGTSLILYVDGVETINTTLDSGALTPLLTATKFGLTYNGGTGDWWDNFAITPYDSAPPKAATWDTKQIVGTSLAPVYERFDTLPPMIKTTGVSLDTSYGNGSLRSDGQSEWWYFTEPKWNVGNSFTLSYELYFPPESTVRDIANLGFWITEPGPAANGYMLRMDTGTASAFYKVTDGDHTVMAGSVGNSWTAGPLKGVRYRVVLRVAGDKMLSCIMYNADTGAAYASVAPFTFDSGNRAGTFGQKQDGAGAVEGHRWDNFVLNGQNLVVDDFNPVVKIYDQFTGTNNALGMTGRVTPTGQAWQYDTGGGQLGIVNNAAFCDSGYGTAWVESGTANGVMEMDVYTGSTSIGYRQQMMFRNGTSGNVTFRVEGANQFFYLGEHTGGGMTNIADSSGAGITWAPNTWYHLKAEFIGTTVTCYVDGVMAIPPTTVTQHATNTQIGFMASMQSQLFDNFTFAPAAVWTQPTSYRSTPIGNKPWMGSNSSPWLTSNGRLINTAGTGALVADTKYADVNIEFDYFVGTGTPDGGFTIRYSDSSNGLRLLAYNGSWQLQRIAGGSGTDIGGGAVGSAPAGTTHHVKIVTEGSKIKIWDNGQQIFDVTETFVMTETRHGPAANNNTTVWWDNIQITPNGIIAADDFTGSDSTTSVWNPPSGPGRVWPVSNGNLQWMAGADAVTWGISSNRLVNYVTNGYLWADPGVADFDLTCTVNTGPTGFGLTVKVNGMGGPEYVAIYPTFATGTGWRVIQYVGGAAAEDNQYLGSPSAINTTYNLRVRCQGDQFSVYVDGVRIITTTLLPQIVSGTWIVLSNPAPPSGYWDSITIRELPPSTDRSTHFRTLAEGTRKFVLGTDHDFESGTGNWNNVAQSIATSTVRSFSGPQSLRVTWNTLGGTPRAELNVTGQLTAGKSYTYTAWVYVPTGSPDVTLSHWGGPTANIADGPVVSTKDAWVQTSMTVVAGSQGGTSDVLWVRNTSPTTAGDVWVDDVQLTEADVSRLTTWNTLEPPKVPITITRSTTWNVLPGVGASTTASLTLSGSGTARAAAPAAAASLTLTGSGTAQVRAAGTASLSLSGTAGPSIAVSAAASLSLTATGAAQTTVTSSASLALSATGTARVAGGSTASLTLTGIGTALAPVVGTASLTFSGTGTGSSIAAASSNATLTLSASGAATTTGAGTASLSLTGVGTARTATSATASLTLTGAGTARAAGASTASLTLTATGTALASGTSTATLTLSGTGTAQVRTTSSATLTLSATGTPATRATATAALALTATGTAVARAPGTNAASLTLSATGTARAPVTSLASLTLLATSTARARTVGTASLTFTASGTVTRLDVTVLVGAGVNRSSVVVGPTNGQDFITVGASANGTAVVGSSVLRERVVVGVSVLRTGITIADSKSGSVTVGANVHANAIVDDNRSASVAIGPSILERIP